MPSWSGNVIASLISFVAAGIALFVNYRILQQREWFRSEMTKIVKENCAGRVEFEAHAKADDSFQNRITQDLSEKRSEYRSQHEDHYRHAGKTEIHQPSMSSDLLSAKFETIHTQVAAVGSRVDSLARLVENSLKRP